jgi:hypothetical protein
MNKSSDPTILDLSGLNLTDENLKNMNLQDKVFTDVYLQNNNLVHLDSKYLPKFTGNLVLNDNKIKTLDLTNFKGDLLDIANNKIRSVSDIKFGTHTDFIINLSNNPVEKSILTCKDLNIKQIKKRKNEENVEYLTYTFPKGTVLFRNVNTMRDYIGNYVGYEDLKAKDDKYYLRPDQITYFTTSPYAMGGGSFGNITGIFVLNNDIEVFLGFSPSRLNKWKLLNTLYKDCPSHSVFDQEENQYKVDSKCLSDEYKKINIAGSFQDLQNYYLIPQDMNKESNMYYPIYKSYDGTYQFPELAIYPRKKREIKEVVMDKSEFSYEWLSKYIKEFNYSPIEFFENVSYEDYMNTFNKYLSNDGNNNFHFTVNKKDGTYVCREFASSKTLKNCVKDNVLEYLKHVE